jgi:hypothetical protein
LSGYEIQVTVINRATRMRVFDEQHQALTAHDVGTVLRDVGGALQTGEARLGRNDMDTDVLYDETRPNTDHVIDRIKEPPAERLAQTPRRRVGTPRE